MDELEQLRADILERKRKQNERRAKAGKPPMHPELLKKPKKKGKSRAAKPPAPESGDEDDTMLSFEEWKECGWVVKKGEKSAGWDVLGVPQFTRSQVKKINSQWEIWKKKNGVSPSGRKRSKKKSKSKSP